MFKLFRKKKKRLPKSIENALREYRSLLMEGCLEIPCEKCRYLVEFNAHRFTCKRERLMNILMPDYRQEIKRIDNELRK